MKSGSVGDSSGKPEGLKEQFIPDHLFIYVVEGTITCYDGTLTYTLNEGDYCLFRKSRLAKYYSKRGTGVADRIMFCYDESFLKAFQKKYEPALTTFSPADTVIKITPKDDMLPCFIDSLKPYTDDSGRLNKAFEDVKYEELLIILLHNQPDLAGLFFNYTIPEKLDLEKFMNQNYKFNVSIERFAYLTGRSLSAFKRDFKAIFDAAPNHWLIERRLREAYVLIGREHKKASEIYLELGFEDLSHFSLAFKKLFGVRPTELAAHSGNVPNT